MGPRRAGEGEIGRERRCRMSRGNRRLAPRERLLRPLRSFAGVPGAPRSRSWPAASRPLSLWGGRCRRPRATGKVTRCVILQLSRAARNADACERSGHVITHRPPLPDLTDCMLARARAWRGAMGVGSGSAGSAAPLGTRSVRPCTGPHTLRPPERECPRQPRAARGCLTGHRGSAARLQSRARQNS